mgnify:CR=1 FL=1
MIISTILGEISLADAHISRIVLEHDYIVVEFVDWKERACSLVFNEMLGMELCGPLHPDLSHIIVDEHDSFIAKCRHVADGNMKELAGNCFSIYSVDSNVPMIKIVARTAHATVHDQL